MNKNILIACYYFPPYPGIGGRRTAKFCKYLLKKGYIIHVIKVDNPFPEKSNWLSEVEHPNIKIYSLPLFYPESLVMGSDTQKKESGFLGKINAKISYHYYSLIQKRRIWDLTFNWEKPFTDLARRIIEENKIDNFIVSVSPHYYAWYAAKLKRECFPHLNLIIDFRDPWLTLRDFGLQTMSESQTENEKCIIKETVEQANYLISPSSFVLDEFKTTNETPSNFLEIPHAYDSDDIELSINKNLNEASGKLKFIYPGTLYTDILPSLIKLNEALSILKSKNEKLYQSIEIDFYVDELHYMSYFSEHKSVQFHSPIGKKIFDKVAESNVVLILYAEHNKNYRTTKFYEFLPFQKPYFYIGPIGDTYHFIMKNQLGTVFSSNDSANNIADYFENLYSGNNLYEPKISYKEFSFERQTEKLEKLFK